MSLNSAQKEAVETLDGPLLIIAGAGSGKTRVLTHRLAHLIKTKKANADEILAVTFTNKAAREMKERVEKILKLPTYDLWISTFHSACVRILRREIPILGYSTQFVIYDEQDQLAALKRCFKLLSWDTVQLNPRMVLGQINKAKNQGITADEFQKRGLSFIDEKIAKVFQTYEEMLKKSNALDFGDLLLLTVRIFRQHPTILEKYQKQFRYCLVDEYQDTNHIQYLLMKLLCEKHENLCVVGDEDQSIYSWRGADISHILSFEKDFPKAKVIKLEENYRSTKNIIEASSELISCNQERKEKKLYTQNEKGEPIRIIHLEDEYHEANFVVSEIIHLQKEKELSLNDIALFYRTHAQSRVFEDQFRREKIPYEIYGGIHFYGRGEIKDIMGYFKLILNSEDSISFTRIINTPPRGIGDTTVEKIVTLANIQKTSPYQALQDLCQKQMMDARALKKTNAFLQLMENLIQKSKILNVQELYHEILDQTGYIRYLKENTSIESESKIQNLEELDVALGEFLKRNPKGTLISYLEEVTLVSDIDTLNESDEVVKLMTLHSAKGLEFPVIFMVGLEEGCLPHRESHWDAHELEEERRLCYVGMTRAKKNLYLTYTSMRRVLGTPQLNLPSRFLDEISKKYIERMDLRKKHPRKESTFLDNDDFDQTIPENPFSVGRRIRHPMFGTGVICRVEGEDENTKVTIKFDRGGVKKFMASQTVWED